MPGLGSFDIGGLSIPGIHLPTPPIIAPNPVGQAESANDAAVPDQKMPLSSLLTQHGFGAKGSRDNQIARGVIGAESGYRVDADNGICCVGPMQVNLNHMGECGIPGDEDAARKWLKNWNNNLEAGHCILKMQGWEAWETYTNGSYKRFMGKDPIITVSKKTATGAVGAAVSSAVSPLAWLAKLIKALFEPSTYARLGKGFLGFVLVVLGTGALVFVIANKASGGNVGSTVKTAAAAAAL